MTNPEKTAERIPGIDCPRCGKFIQISISELLTVHSIRCPHCLLQLIINRKESGNALEALRKVEEAHRQVDKTRKFNR